LGADNREVLTSVSNLEHTKQKRPAFDSSRTKKMRPIDCAGANGYGEHLSDGKDSSGMCK
jgi:hypothetical protein